MDYQGYNYDMTQHQTDASKTNKSLLVYGGNHFNHHFLSLRQLQIYSQLEESSWLILMTWQSAGQWTRIPRLACASNWCMIGSVLPTQYQHTMYKEMDKQTNETAIQVLRSAQLCYAHVW